MVNPSLPFVSPTGVKPQDVDILITNCSIFCPTPSLGSMLINKFKFRKDVQVSVTHGRLMHDSRAAHALLTMLTRGGRVAWMVGVVRPNS